MYGTPPATAAGTTLRLFGQTVAIPVAVLPAILRYRKAIINGAAGFIGLLVLLFGILPALAATQISGADQALVTAVTHQSSVEAGFASLFAPGPSSSDLNVIQAQTAKNAQSVNDALAVVRADRAAIDGADLRLMILQWLALPSRSAITRERTRLAPGRRGLGQADVALTAGSNQAKVLLPVSGAMIDFAKMYAAMSRRDLAGAGAPYADAHQKLELAMSLDHAPGVPEALAKEASALNDLVNNMESLVQAIQRRDAAGTKKYSDAMEASLKTMTTLPKAIPADYQIKTYGGMQKAYEAAMNGVKSAG